MNSTFVPSGLKLSHQFHIGNFIAENSLGVGTTTAIAAGLPWYLLKSDGNGIKHARGWPFIGQWAFFTRRSDFLKEGFEKFSSESSFRFNILQHQVVALKGEDARKTFYDQRDLSFDEGYALLFGGGPDVKDVVRDGKKKTEQEELSHFARRLTSLLKMNRLVELTPLFMADIQRNMNRWGDSGKFDPFDVMYSMVFQLTTRAAGAREIADSVEKCKELERLYWQVEMGTTPTSVLFPWLPSAPRKRKLAATGEIYELFDNIIKARRAEGRREEDALQYLMDRGDSTPEIISFIMGTLFAGIVNSGLMSAWIFIFLDQEPEWRDKVEEELRTLLKKHAPAKEQPESVSERFSRILPQVWENEMPVLEACLRETIRLIFSGAALRRVVKGDTQVSGSVVPNGSFLVYWAGETRLNPSIFPDPTKFNPGRYTEGQDKAQAYAFLGWGAGRHPCLGKRFAQYEMKALVATFLASYTFNVFDSAGNKPDPSVTVPDRNNIYQIFYVNYTKRQQPL